MHHIEQMHSDDEILNAEMVLNSIMMFQHVTILLAPKVLKTEIFIKLP